MSTTEKTYSTKWFLEIVLPNTLTEENYVVYLREDN